MQTFPSDVEAEMNFNIKFLLIGNMKQNINKAYFKLKTNLKLSLI